MAEPLSLEARQAITDDLAPVAVELAARVRDEHPDVLYVDLLAGRSPFQLACLCLLLAAACNIDETPRTWWRWVEHREAIQHPSPIVWPDGQVPIEELDLNAVIARMTSEGSKAWEIADATGLTAKAVAKRLERRRAAAAKAGVG